MAEQTRQQQIEEFEQARKKHTDDWLQSFRTAKRCAWCGWEDKLNRSDLCAPCNRISRRLAKALKEDLSDQRVVARIRRAEAERQNAMNTVAVQQKLMRHADVRTTMNVYGDVVTDEMSQAASKIAGLALKVIAS